MKIKSINYNFNYINQSYSKSQNNQFFSYMDYNSVSNPMEILGRSQILFGNKNFELSNDDKKFVDILAKNLRLSSEEKSAVHKTLKDFLKYNNFKSLDDIAKDNNYKNQAILTNMFDKELNLSDMDLGIVMDDLHGRLYYEDKYIPIEKKYKKDFEVVDHILDKYKMDKVVIESIFDLFVYEAKSMNYDTIFDIFKPENNPDKSFAMMSLRKNLDQNTSLNLLIDFGIAASKDAKIRHSEINKHKITDKYRDEETDYEIASDIISHFDLNEDLDDKIAEAVSKFHSENKNVKQIAFEIADKYNLPTNAEKYIEEVVLNFNDIKNVMKNK